MIAIVSGKIINAWKVNPNVWLFKLKQFFSSFGESPFQWEIFGGNAFLLKVKFPEESLFVAMIIKAIFRQINELDVAISIGIGEEAENKNPLQKNEGIALKLALGSNNEKIPKKASLSIATENQLLNDNINLLLEFALINMNEWSTAEAEVAELCLLFPEKNQQELAEWLRIKQSAISQRRARAHLDLLLKLDAYYRTQILNHSR